MRRASCRRPRAAMGSRTLEISPCESRGRWCGTRRAGRSIAPRVRRCRRVLQSVARRAASSDIAGSIVRRTSNSWRTNALRSSSVAESPFNRISGSRSATTGRLPAAFEITRCSQALDRLANRGAGHAELFAQLPFGRHRAARLQLAGSDRFQQLSADFGRNGAPLDRAQTEYCWLPSRLPRSCPGAGAVTWSGCQTIRDRAAVPAPRSA